MSAELTTADVAELGRRLALLRMPYVTVAEVLRNIEEQCNAMLAAVGKPRISVDFVWDASEQGSATTRFPFVLGYDGSKAREIQVDATKREGESVFGLAQTEALLREGRDNGASALEEREAQIVRGWWEPPLEGRRDLDAQVEFVAAVLQLVLLHPHVGRFGVPNLVHARVHGGEACLVQLSQTGAGLPLARLCPFAPGEANHEWTEPRSQFLDNEEYRSAWEHHAVYKWIQCIQRLSEFVEWGLYVPTAVLGRFNGYLALRLNDVGNEAEAANVATALLGDEGPLSQVALQRWARALDVAWTDGVGQLALAELRAVSPVDGLEKDPRSPPRQVPTVKDTIDLWQAHLKTMLGWTQESDVSCETWCDAPAVSEINVDGLLAFLQPRAADGASVPVAERFGGLRWGATEAGANEEGADLVQRSKCLAGTTLLRDLLRARQSLEDQWQRRQWEWRNASAAVMARNLSHNIGAHVLWHVRESLTRRSDHRRVEPVMEEVAHETTEPEVNGAVSLEPSDSDLEVLLEHLQQRMDFIAQVARGGPAWATRMTAFDLFSSVVRQRILWQNIVRSDVGSAAVRFTFRVKGHAGELGHEPWDKWPGLLEGTRRQGMSRPGLEGVLLLADTSSEKTRIRDALRKIELAIPHDAVGGQAFHVVLENIVRNAARHGHLNDLARSELAFTIEFATDEKNDRYAVTLWGHSSTTEEQFAKVQGALQEPLAGEGGEPTGTNYGLKEMKIAAGFLRAERPETLLAAWNGKEDPLVAAGLTEDGHLQFRLAIRRTLLAVVVACDIPWVADHDRFSSVESLTSALSSGASLSHEFLILGCSRDAAEQLLREHGSRLPARVLWTHDGDRVPGCVGLSESGLARIRAAGDRTALHALLWEEWVRGRWPQKKLCLMWEEVRGLPESDLLAHCSHNAGATCGATCLVFDHPGRLASAAQYSFYTAIKAGVGESVLLKAMRERPELIWPMIEAAATCICVVDERASAVRRQPTSMLGWEGAPPTVEQAWGTRGVKLIDHETFWSGGLDTVKELSPDFLLVHRGVLKKHSGDVGGAVRDLSQGPWRLVVVTGGGPVRDMEAAPVLEWSTLARALVQQQDAKLPLVQVLYALRAQPR